MVNTRTSFAWGHSAVLEDAVSAALSNINPGDENERIVSETISFAYGPHDIGREALWHAVVVTVYETQINI